MSTCTYDDTSGGTSIPNNARTCTERKTLYADIYTCSQASKKGQMSYTPKSVSGIGIAMGKRMELISYVYMYVWT